VAPASFILLTQPPTSLTFRATLQTVSTIASCSVPQWEPSLPNVIAKRHFDNQEKSINDFSFVGKVLLINKELHRKYDYSEIEYISLTDKLCDGNYCLAKVDNDNTPLVWDYGHLSLEGSEFVVSNIVKDRITPYLSN